MTEEAVGKITLVWDKNIKATYALVDNTSGCTHKVVGTLKRFDSSSILGDPNGSAAQGMAEYCLSKCS